MKKAIIFVVTGAIVIHFILLLNIKFTAWPEMLAWPYLITKGWLPYRDIAIAHTPILLFLLALFDKIVGIGVWQIKIFSWFLILVTDLVVYFVVKKLTNVKTAALALLAYIPMQLFFDGNGIWFDYLVTPLALLSFYFIRKKRWLLAGVFWGLSFFTKQTAFWFLPGIIFLFWGKNFWYKVKEFAIGALIVTAAIFISFGLLGILPKFLYWAFEFGIGILPRSPGQLSFPSVRVALASLFPFSVLLLAILKDWKRYLPLVLWAVLGIMGVYPRWELFHFQPGLPYLALTLALLTVGVKKSGKMIIGVLTLYLICLFVLVGRSLVRSWHQPDRFAEPSVIKTAQRVLAETKPGDKIFVLNSWDSLYALSDRLPAVKPLVPELPWYLNLPQTESSLVNDLVANPPKLVVMQPYTETGLSSFKPKKLTDYILKYYKPAEVIDNSFYILKR